MGTMGPRIFDNDAALDMLDSVARVPLAEIEAFLASNQVGPEDIDAVAACVAIHIALVHECGATRPSLEFVDRLSHKLMQVFDQEYDKLSPSPEFKPERREVLATALNRYRELSNREER